MKTRKLRIQTHTLLFALLLFMVAGWGNAVQAQEPFNCDSAMVWTDKDDYAPGEFALISGSGWMPGEPVDLILYSTNLQVFELFYVVADEDGNFTGLYYEILEIHLGEQFVLNAEGVTSGCEAVWYFTDANSALALVSPSSAVYGSNIVLTATLTQQGGGTGSGTPLTNRTIDFTINNGVVLGSSSTDDLGVATLSVNINQPVANYTGSSGIKANFAGDPSNNPYSGSWKTNAINITKATTTISYVAGSGVYGNNITLNAIANLPNLPVDFSLDGTYAGTAITNESGLASLTVLLASVPSTLKNAGTYHNKVTASITETTNYFGTTSTGDLTVTKRNLTVTATGQNKIYDGTTAATVTLSHDAIAGDDVTASYTSAVFSNKNIGVREITVSGISISGTSAGNYTVSTTAQTSATITKRDLYVTATGINKVYDGIVTATVTLTTDKISTDFVTATYSSAFFSNKNVGTGKTVTVSGVNIIGSDANNYNLVGTFFYTTADITPKDLTVTAHGYNRVYNATNNASGCVSFTSDKYAADMVSVLFTSATFDNKNVGTGKTITVTGISLTGVDAINYTLINTTATTTANITPKGLVVSAAGINKIYDGTTDATVNLSTDALIGDVVTAAYTSASFADANVANGIVVSVTGISISGADADNYNLTNTTTSTTANITPKDLVVSASGISKIYDGTTVATVTLSTNALEGDDVTAAYTSASFADANVADGIVVSVSGISISGDDAGNYSFNATATTTADITPASLIITANDATKYAGQANPVFTVSYDGFVGSEDYLVLGGTLTFDTNADVNSCDGEYYIHPSGLTSGNYTITFIDGTLTVVDNIAPTVVTQNITVYLDASGNATITPEQINNGSTDNCTPANELGLALDKTTFTCADISVAPTLPADLIISEYVEGSSYNKYIEIYNGTGAAVDLSGYHFRLFSNGATEPTTTTLPLSGTLANGETIVYKNSPAFLTLPEGVTAITNNSIYFTGDDAFSLVKTNGDFVDIIGRIGDDPGEAWTGPGGYSTLDKTLRRKASVLNGIKTSPTGTGPAAFTTLTTEWDIFNIDDVSGLGSHTMTTDGGTGVTVTLTVTDANGNSNTSTAIVTVVDNVAPEALAQNVTVQLDEFGNGSTTAAAVDNGSNDACGIASLVLSKTTFNCTNVGANPVTLTVTDNNGNVSTATATVTVEDNVAPEAIAQNVTVQLDEFGNGSTTAAAVDNGSNDACGIASLVLSKTAFDCSNVGPNNVVLTVTDVNNNVSTANAVVTVVDDIAPTAIAQNVTIYLDADGEASVTAEEVDNESFDNCAIATLALDKYDFTCANVGPNDLVLTVTDINGNSASKTAVVTVEDNVPPVITCVEGSPFSRYVDAYQTYYTVSGDEFDATAADACGIASLTYTINGGASSTVSFLAGVQLALGTNTIVWTAVDVNNNSSQCTTVVNIVKRITTLTYTGDLEVQYSDQVDLSAVLMDVSDEDNPVPVVGKTITFEIGIQSTTALTDQDGIASTTLVIIQAPGNYTVSSVFEEDDSYLGSSDDDEFTITKEDAIVDYIGTEVQATVSATSGAATVLLMATIRDAIDGFSGDIRNACVRFVNNDNNTPISGWLTPGLVNQNDLTVGQVSFLWEVNIGNATYATYSVGIEVGCYYTGNDDAVLTVYKPTGDFITGGGHIIPTESAGQYASTPGLKTNFGFNVKFNKKGTNLQGGMNIIFRRMEDGVKHDYQIKTNAMTSLGVNVANPSAKTAEFTSKANLTDVTDPLNPISVGGGYNLRVTMVDRGEPGSNDQIGITLWDGTTLLYSSWWTGTTTLEMLLSGGNLVVHSGFSFPEGKSIELELVPEDIYPVSYLEVYPNPTRDKATFRFVPQADSKARLEIYHLNGSLVHTLYEGDVTAGTLYEFVYQPADRHPGMLLYRLILDNKVINGKLVIQQ